MPFSYLSIFWCACEYRCTCNHPWNFVLLLPAFQNTDKQKPSLVACNSKTNNNAERVLKLQAANGNTQHNTQTTTKKNNTEATQKSRTINRTRHHSQSQFAAQLLTRARALARSLWESVCRSRRHILIGKPEVRISVLPFRSAALCY